ncbi:CU044_5270 family protein [Phytohabitans kaempferiae]|uniref:CU044_5270 family protein n=1 Tax=Phytohabitans kaempferiae TaxID=1620943 RepID=A0ABV6MBJ6_9ACTN
MTDTADPSPGRSWRPPALAAGAVVLILVVAGAVVGPRLIGGDDPRPDQAAAPAGQATTNPSPDPAGSGPVECMDGLADAVAARSPDPVQAGRYTYVHSRWWGEDMSYSEKEGSTQTRVMYESKLWRAADGSGRQDVISIPGERSRPDDSAIYTAGGLAGVLPEPIATSPDVLVTQLQVHSPREMGPQWVLRAVADVYQSHTVPQPVRVALLRVLAGQTSGLECENGAVDREGRTGIAVAVNSNSDKTRDKLIFDPADGRLLAAEQIILRNPPALTGQTPRTVSYWLFLETSQVADLPPASPA